MSKTSAREVHLIARPIGAMQHEHIDTISVELPSLQNGDLLVRNQFMSVDPYMLGRMQGSINYIEPFKLGEAMVGEAVGKVLESKHPDFSAGDYVQHFFGWRDQFVCPGESARVISRIKGVSLDAHLDIMSNTTGMAAYAGMLDIAKIQNGEAVFITAGAGAVGAAACQIALALGCRVVASAGSKQKVNWLENDIGIHKAFNYRDFDSAESFDRALADAFPDGIDVTFENVGGFQLEAALSQMNNHGRIVLCGLIAYYEEDYNNDWSVNTGPRNFIQIADKWLRVQGFHAPDYADRMPEMEQRIGQWIADGQIQSRTTIMQGLDSAVDAMSGIMAGKNTGKMMIQV